MANAAKTYEAVAKIIDALKKPSKGVSDEDKENLVKVLDDRFVRKLFQVHDALHNLSDQKQRRDCIALCLEILKVLEAKILIHDEKCQELRDIIRNPYFRCLIESHDNITYQTYKDIPSLPPNDSFTKLENSGPPIRVVGLTRRPTEPLGITVAKHDDNCIYIQRILRGTMVEKQGLLNVGDVLQEINGEKIGTNVKEIQSKLATIILRDGAFVMSHMLNCSTVNNNQMLESAQGSINVKVIPVSKDSRGVCQVYLRCHFDYDPTRDSSFPQNEIGLCFQRGDIIEIIDQSDFDWWQAVRLDDPTKKTGLVPSSHSQQMKQVVNLKDTSEAKGSIFKKKKKFVYRSSENKLLDCLDVRLYEEVTRMPPVERKVMVFVGAQGVGRRTLKNKLLSCYPDRYQDVLRDTSREQRDGEQDGKGYIFRDKEEMNTDILAGMYVEWGEVNGNLYGTRLNAVRDIIQAGKICIMDVDPSALKLLRTAEFMPLIVFVQAPRLDILVKSNRQNSSTKQYTNDELKEVVRESKTIEEKYHHYFDLKLSDEDLEKNYITLREHIDKSSTELQWVPVSWVY